MPFEGGKLPEWHFSYKKGPFIVSVLSLCCSNPSRRPRQKARPTPWTSTISSRSWRVCTSRSLCRVGAGAAVGLCTPGRVSPRARAAASRRHTRPPRSSSSPPPCPTPTSASSRSAWNSSRSKR